MSPEALRVPPHSIEAEQSVIGALLLDNRVFDKLGELRADEFYNAGHQYIFEAMHAAWVAGQTFDAVTVSEALKATGKLEFVGGLAYIGALQNAVPSSANAARYALIVRERAKLRGLAAVGAEVSELGFKADIGADERLQRRRRASRNWRSAARRRGSCPSPMRWRRLPTGQPTRHATRPSGLDAERRP